MACFDGVRDAVGVITGRRVLIRAPALIDRGIHPVDLIADYLAAAIDILVPLRAATVDGFLAAIDEIGRASCRERV